MKTEKRIIGDLGEGIARLYFEKRGHTCLDMNYLKKWGEIDLITKKGSILHFIEVKSYKGHTGNVKDIYRAIENVHAKKLDRLWRTVHSYLLENNDVNATWQLDVVVVKLDVHNKKAYVTMLDDVVV